MNSFRNPTVMLLVVAGLASFALAGLEPGKLIKLTLRGGDTDEQAKGDGDVRLPLLEKSLPAQGLTAERFARAAEARLQFRKLPTPIPQP